MKYALSNKEEAEKAFTYLTELTGKESMVEIIKVSPKRSLNQNSYLHVTFGIFALETGYTTDEAKTIYKRLANPAIYVYKKNDQTFLRSSADLTVSEMTTSIERWRKYGAEQSVIIPAPNDNKALMYWENQIQTQGKYYL